MNKTAIARRIISSKYYFQKRLERMDCECAYYIDQVQNAKNAILRKSFAKMVWVYHRRYEFYLKKCTGNESGKSL